MEAHGQLMLSANVRRPGTKYKLSKFIFSITSVAFIVVHICKELLQFPSRSLIGISGTLSRCALRLIIVVSVWIVLLI